MRVILLNLSTPGPSQECLVALCIFCRRPWCRRCNDFPGLCISHWGIHCFLYTLPSRWLSSTAASGGLAGHIYRHDNGVPHCLPPIVRAMWSVDGIWDGAVFCVRFMLVTGWTGGQMHSYINARTHRHAVHACSLTVCVLLLNWHL